MRSEGAGLAVLAALAACAGSGWVVPDIEPHRNIHLRAGTVITDSDGVLAERAALNAAVRRLTGGIGHILRGAPWPSREGWTNARYQRAARKARNVQRNRKAHRG